MTWAIALALAIHLAIFVVAVPLEPFRARRLEGFLIAVVLTIVTVAASYGLTLLAAGGPVELPFWEAYPRFLAVFGVGLLVVLVVQLHFGSHKAMRFVRGIREPATRVGAIASAKSWLLSFEGRPSRGFAPIYGWNIAFELAQHRLYEEGADILVDVVDGHSSKRFVVARARILLAVCHLHQGKPALAAVAIAPAKDACNRLARGGVGAVAALIAALDEDTPTARAELGLFRHRGRSPRIVAVAALARAHVLVVDGEGNVHSALDPLSEKARENVYRLNRALEGPANAQVADHERGGAPPFR